jgi:hypothetical protein
VDLTHPHLTIRRIGPSGPRTLWQKQFFENGTAAFANTGRRRQAEQDAKDRKIAALEEKLLRKNEVLAELMEEHVQLKKELGEP